jgi:uncharacterized membrane protein
MKQLIKKFQLVLTGLVLLSAFGSVALVPASVVEAKTAKQAVCEGVGLAGGDKCKTPTGTTGIPAIVKLVVNTISWVVGIVAVVMIIIGGFKYVISSGDSNNINSAKNTILYALVGLAVVAMAQVIVRFVLNTIT